MKKDKNLLLLLITNIILLIIGQISGILIIIILSLILMLYIVIKNYKKNLVNMMLFYLPFSPILKIHPNSFTFFSVSLIIVALIFWYNGRFKFDRYSLIIGIGIVVSTLIGKLIVNNPISLNYLLFIILILFIPNFILKYRKYISFEKNTYYLAIGIILACSISFLLKNNVRMQDYIYIYQWTQKDLTRFSGFYGDANYYSSQILISITSLLILLSLNKKSKVLPISIMLGLLIYLGLLSVSKTFIIILVLILIIWMIYQSRFTNILRLRILTITTIGLLIILITSKEILGSQISMYVTRFSNANTISGLTTGRSSIYTVYLDYFEAMPINLLFGRGYSNVYASGLNGHASHDTIIQSIYQFGFIGNIIFTGWMLRLGQLFNDKKLKYSIGTIIIISLIVIGFFASWLTLDMIFFDEFLFTIILFFSAIQFIKEVQLKTK